jgi:hypothetical protein
MIDCTDFPIKVKSGGYYSLEGMFCIHDKSPSAFTEYPFKEQPIEKDTLVYYRDSEEEEWKVGYYSHFECNSHLCFVESKKSTETNTFRICNIVTTENPLT